MPDTVLNTLLELMSFSSPKSPVRWFLILTMLLLRKGLERLNNSPKIA